jgi:hypothetical protein
VKTLVLLLNFASAGWTLFIVYGFFMVMDVKTRESSEGVVVSEYYLFIVLTTLFVTIYAAIAQEEKLESDNS